MKHINLHIFNENDKYEWQNQLGQKLKGISFENGLFNVMCRTGTGKTLIPALELENDRKTRSATRVIVPSSHRHLLTQHTITLRRFFKKNHKVKVYTLNKNNENRQRIKHSVRKKIRVHDGNFLLKIKDEGGSYYKYYIQAFCCNTHSTYNYCNEMLGDNEAIYLDEIHSIATQFGLKHAGCMFNHNNTGSQSLKKYVKREREESFNSLIKICNHNKVVTLSATSDDIICNDLLTYYGIINIANIIIHHTKKCFPEIPIIYQTEDDIYVRLIESMNHNIESGGTTVIFCSCKNQLNEYYDKLNCYLRDTKLSGDVEHPDILTEEQLNDTLYKNISETNENLDKTKIEKSAITFLINKGTTGLDSDSIENIFIVRKLSDAGSSSRDKEKGEKLMSNLALQMMGRLRKSGKIYWLHETQDSHPKDDTTLFDATEKLFKLVSEKKNIIVQEIMTIINQNKLDDSVSEKYIRQFIFRLIKEGNFDGKKGIILKPTRELCKRGGGSKIFQNIQKCIDNEDSTLFKIDEYLELEKKLIDLYKKIYEETMGDADIFDITNRKSIRDSDYRSTGGASAKPNISKREEQKGIRMLKLAISNSDLLGESAFLKPYDEYEADEVGNDKSKFMHAKWKKDLSDEERTKSKYAIPIKDTLIEGLNQKETEEMPILNYDVATNTITCNYTYLLKCAGRRYNDQFRSEEDITTILTEYSRLQNECD